ncbi:MAG: cytochrome c [Candidatus Thiodiazotropha sp.]
MRQMILSAALLLPLLSACVEQSDVAEARNDLTRKDDGVVREVDFFRLAQGARLYQMNCAECHGSHAQGAPDWRQRDADGMFPPPPLNGTGHAWHHPTNMLRHVIANGSPGDQGNMPAWGDRLSGEEIDAIIAWFQSKWPDPFYPADLFLSKSTSLSLPPFFSTFFSALESSCGSNFGT